MACTHIDWIVQTRLYYLDMYNPQALGTRALLCIQGIRPTVISDACPTVMGLGVCLLHNIRYGQQPAGGPTTDPQQHLDKLERLSLL